MNGWVHLRRWCSMSRWAWSGREAGREGGDLYIPSLLRQAWTGTGHLWCCWLHSMCSNLRVSWPQVFFLNLRLLPNNTFKHQSFRGVAPHQFVTFCSFFGPRHLVQCCIQLGLLAPWMVDQNQPNHPIGHPTFDLSDKISCLVQICLVLRNVP